VGDDLLRGVKRLPKQWMTRLTEQVDGGLESVRRDERRCKAALAREAQLGAALLRVYASTRLRVYEPMLARIAASTRGSSGTQASGAPPTNTRTCASAW